jgi:DNA-binding transcriptional LysR family regulator
VRIEQLEYVSAVTRFGSLRRASEHLHVSQPAVSEAIAKLERELGVTLLDRRRSGARISREGQELLRGMEDVLDAVDRLRRLAGDRRAVHRAIRIGTVHAGTARLLLPAIRGYQGTRPGATVEISNLQQEQIERSLAESGLDLGLVNLLSGDDVSPDLVGVPLAHGRPVAVLPADHPLTALDEVAADDLRGHPFVGMRTGYLMHRFAHRLFGSGLPQQWHTTDGAEMGKMMVAEGFGVSLLPDYSVLDDPLERAGLITVRPLAEDTTRVTMMLLHRRTTLAEPVRALVAAFQATAGLERPA